MLGPYETTGGFLDIVSPPDMKMTRNHAWHQDSGLEQNTVMLGFPSSDGYVGPGVFSHVVLLSHPLEPPEVPGPVIIPGALPEDYITRPVYSRGREVILYRDSHHVHSAPDLFIRAGIWRFM